MIGIVIGACTLSLSLSLYAVVKALERIADAIEALKPTVDDSTESDT
jgi:hypothetical protein